MFKTLAVSSLVATATSHVVLAPLFSSERFVNDPWPGLNAYLNFKADLTAYTEN